MCDMFKSNQIYLQAQNIRENADDKQKVEQMGTAITNRSNELVCTST